MELMATQRSARGRSVVVAGGATQGGGSRQGEGLELASHLRTEHSHGRRRISGQGAHGGRRGLGHAVCSAGGVGLSYPVHPSVCADTSISDFGCV
jgi:hypothetical protein